MTGVPGATDMRPYSSALFVMLAALSLAAGTAHAQTAAVGPYYATPSWNQKVGCTSLSNCPRFVVLSNWNSEAVLDRETGLVWERAPADFKLAWSLAVQSCLVHSTGGRFGWRLPRIEELSSLAEPDLDGRPVLPSGHPFQNIFEDRFFWSATASDTPFDDAPLDGARGVNFSGGYFFAALKGNAYRFWCVRGAQGLDAQ
jgi:hypothetical protein